MQYIAVSSSFYILFRMLRKVWISTLRLYSITAMGLFLMTFVTFILGVKPTSMTRLNTAIQVHITVHTDNSIMKLFLRFSRTCPNTLKTQTQTLLWLLEKNPSSSVVCSPFMFRSLLIWLLHVIYKPLFFFLFFFGQNVTYIPGD